MKALKRDKVKKRKQRNTMVSKKLVTSVVIIITMPQYPIMTHKSCNSLCLFGETES